MPRRWRERARAVRTFRASDGLRLAYLLDDFTDPWCTSETLLLLHAAQGSSRRFYAWVPHLAREVRVVRLDLRGHGWSELPTRAPTIGRLVDDVVELSDHLGCARVHLAGSSAGAMIAMQLAIARPERVASLGIFAATAGLKEAAFDFDAWAAAIEAKGIRRFLADTIWHRFDVAKTDPRLIAWWLDLAAASNPDPRYAARFVALMRGLDLRPDLGRIACPTLAVVPDGDPEHALAEYEALREGIADIRFVVVEAGYHNITDAIPDRCARELRDFLRDLRA